MWTMGDDFKYQYADSWFKQMDKLIHYVNLDGRVNALYSTPSIYTDAKYATMDSWPVKIDDFFPYADAANAYWTGYFTSRPSFKGYVRVMSGYYLAARQLEFLIGRNGSVSGTETLADALAIAQHHDGVSGTEKQHVAADYTKRLHMGYVAVVFLIVLLDFLYFTTLPSKINVVVVYNPLGWKREEIIRIPVLVDKVIVRDFNGNEVESQLLPVTNASLTVRSYHVRAYLGKNTGDAIRYWLAFSVSVPPLGFSTYIVSGSQSGVPENRSIWHPETAYAGGRSTISSTSTVLGTTHRTLEIGQGNLKLLFSSDGGKLTQYINKKNSVNIVAEQSYIYYSGFSGKKGDSQASGAYILRPNGTFPIEAEEEASLTVMKGPLLDELHQQLLHGYIRKERLISNNGGAHLGTLITRIYKGKEHTEMEFTVGPIPIDDGIGKEIAAQITTTMKTNGTFYTDSNGRDFLRRIRDYREDWDLQINQPIAGNYYPLNLGICVEDGNMELSVLVDHAVGGSSIKDGQIELMLHRRLLHDDSRGVGEALNETVCILNDYKGLMIKGKFFIKIDPIGEGAKWRRTLGREIYSPLILAFAEQDGDDWMGSHVLAFSGIDSAYSLPDNVAIGKVTEMSLSANQEKAEMEKKRLVWKVEGSSNEETKVFRGGPVDPVQLVVELAPMEIRTFFVAMH
ncbi:hypothetical protein Cgig2_001068 [Carnegiea gigantea]|uniref:Glycoside hydrolase family 38 central domain-containing protein n=1 Tax=Carnegiea gigantea TaxID=171969 RepID=A0A9Q1K1H3_9CARY|nr:hypothetical protein Cgig2_001068 [Carnegiea gigantea]